MVPCIFLCGPVENMLGPVKCGSKLALDQKKVEIFSVVEILYICKIKTKTTTGRVGVYKQIAGL